MSGSISREEFRASVTDFMDLEDAEQFSDWIGVMCMTYMEAYEFVHRMYWSHGCVSDPAVLLEFLIKYCKWTPATSWDYSECAA